MVKPTIRLFIEKTRLLELILYIFCDPLQSKELSTKATIIPLSNTATSETDGFHVSIELDASRSVHRRRGVDGANDLRQDIKSSIPSVLFSHLGFTTPEKEGSLNWWSFKPSRATTMTCELKYLTKVFLKTSSL